MNRFRLLILDFPKQQLDDPIVRQIFTDMVFVKQSNFLRTDPQYIVMDKHDMVGTHYLIYDTSDFLNPKLVYAIRTSFLDRAREHHLELPLMTLLPTLNSSLKQVFSEFKEKHPQLVDCNAWFVESNYSRKNSGLVLSDIGYLMVYLNMIRAGFDNIIGCTNETYHASKWLERIGIVASGMTFEHPVIKSVHKMILMEEFNVQHFFEVYKTNKNLFDSIVEVLPETEKVQPMAEFAAAFFSNFSNSSTVAKVA